MNEATPVSQLVRETIVQHCRTPDSELTATCCVKLRISLYPTFKYRLKTHMFYTAFC